jgi:hypothetical protein
VKVFRYEKNNGNNSSHANHHSSVIISKRTECDNRPTYSHKLADNCGRDEPGFLLQARDTALAESPYGTLPIQVPAVATYSNGLQQFPQLILGWLVKMFPLFGDGLHA